MNQVDEKFQSSLQTAKMILDKLIFDKVGIEYDIKTEYCRWQNSVAPCQCNGQQCNCSQN